MDTAADFVGSKIEVAVRITDDDTGICDGAVYVMAAPEALGVAESVPQLPGAHEDNAQETPSFFGSLATVAVKLCDWPSWSVELAGAATTETAAGADGGVTAGGGLPAPAGEWPLEALEFGTEAQPPLKKAAHKQRTATAAGV
jgi:hypothetical protein